MDISDEAFELARKASGEHYGAWWERGDEKPQDAPLVLLLAEIVVQLRRIDAAQT